MTMIKRLLSVLFVLLVSEILRNLTVWLADFFNPYIDYTNSTGILILSTLQHLIEFLLAMILLFIFFRKKLKNLGFNFNKKVFSNKAFISFFVIWPIIVLLFHIIGNAMSSGFGGYIKGMYPSDVKYMVADLGFNVIMPGIGEEPFFRAFVFLILINYWSGSLKIGKLELSYVSLVTGFIFMTGHISYTLHPFAISVDPTQLIMTFALGVFWTKLFEKTDSLVGTIISHNYSDFITAVFGYVAAFMFYQ